METTDESRWMTLVRKTIDEVRIILVNADGRKLIGERGLTHCLLLDIRYIDERDNGLPGDRSQAEMERLNAKEEQIAARHGMTAMGRVTTAGHRIALFYFRGREVPAQPFIDAMLASCSLNIEAHVLDDPSGEQYARYLEPTQLEHLQERDMVLCKTLKENGDDWSKPREIDHFFFFPDDATASRFVSSLPTQFQHQETTQDPDGGPERMVHVTSFNGTDPELVAPVSALLFELADQAGGEYDGWACHVEKAKKGILGLFKK